MEITREKFVEISCTYLKFLFEEKEVIKKVNLYQRNQKTVYIRTMKLNIRKNGI